jgi:O-antigen/teichoic acid export membrane protein
MNRPQRPPRTIDNVAFAVTGVLLVVSMLGPMLLFARGTSETWGEALAPFASGLCLVAAMFVLSRIEVALPRGKRGWIILGVPVTGIVCGLVFASVDPEHRWLADARFGAVLGSGYALLLWWSLVRRMKKQPVAAR